jgi:hypothetical protein
VQAKIRGYLNGETRLGVKAQSLYAEYIGIWGERGELKHLSTRRKREYSLSSGERKGKSPNLLCVIGYGRCKVGVVGIDRQSRKTVAE